MSGEHPQENTTRAYGRRAFIGVTAVGLSSLLWGRAAWDAAAGASSPLKNAVPAGILPSSGWRIYTVASSMPRFDPATWRLRIEGLVDRPLTLTYDDLKALPRAEQVSTFHCVTGWSVKDVRWAGVRLDDLLAPAGVLPGAQALTFVSSERPYVDTLTLDQAGLADVMLAYEMDGKPLSRPHGAPDAARDPGDVRVQEREVGRADRPRRPGGARLLGAARLRRGRLGRPLQWALSSPS